MRTAPKTGQTLPVDLSHICQKDRFTWSYDFFNQNWHSFLSVYVYTLTCKKVLYAIQDFNGNK